MTTSSPPIPDWVNQGLFLGLIKEHYSNFCSIEKFIINPAVACGENFLSIVLRIQVSIQMKDETIEDVNYVLKIPLDYGYDEDYNHQLFVTELNVYDHLLPELESIYAKNNSFSIKLKPRHFKFTDKAIMPKCDYLLMEDLVANGYKNMDRTVGLDQRQMEAVLRKLAQWHAASVVRVSQIGHYEDSNNDDKESVESEPDDSFQKNCVAFLDCLPLYDLDPPEEILITNYVNDIFKNWPTIPDEILVLNHGDLWCNNIMFKVKEESNEILDVCFVDYQMTHYGTPANDLFCLLMTSPQLGIKLSKFDYFVELYHQELTKHLVSLHYNENIPTLQQLHEILFQYSSYAFSSLVKFIYLMVNNSDDSDENLSYDHQRCLLPDKYIIKPAVSSGENFLSTVLRIQISIQMKDETIEEVNYILKIPLENVYGENYNHKLFVTELDMYDRLVPELESIYAENTSLLVKFKPCHFKFTDNEKFPQCDYLLMEDLIAKGYKNMDRTVGLNQMQIEAVLKKLAQWHAASALRVSQFGKYEDDDFDNHETDESTDDGFERCRVPFLDCLSVYNLEPQEEILIRRFVSRLNEFYINSRTNPDEFSVLNHGDLWCNNIMFKVQEESNEILDVCFVDYQLLNYGTPAQDLFCLLMTSPQLGIKLSKFDYFVEFYHQELTKHLVLLHYNQNIPTLQQLHEILIKNGFYAFICLNQLMFVVEKDSADSDDNLSYDHQRYLLPGNVEQMKLILPWLIERSYIK
ncbi:uncharacterized protein LOC111519459 [Drosophila willistoni]|uniref:uncharacterized protein LOC111519459 n=1 Tax=Drosophila willistoni TaxID=7260 RepID=UPI000C26DA6B|nr:uncharacterized protein LOC111519459 [Drosophila willistoni]